MKHDNPVSSFSHVKHPYSCSGALNPELMHTRADHWQWPTKRKTEADAFLQVTEGFADLSPDI